MATYTNYCNNKGRNDPVTNFQKEGFVMNQ